MNLAPSDATVHVEVSVFENTGHHVEFVALQLEPVSGLDMDPYYDDARLKDVKVRAQKLAAHSDFIDQRCKLQEAWIAEVAHPWLRYRFGTSPFAPGIELQGIWLAVESNLGGTDRGISVEEREPTPSDLDEQKKRTEQKFQTPYYARSTSELVRRFPVVLRTPSQNATLINIEFIWQVPAGDTVDVDLIVDFGNTRTAVLALEHNQVAGIGLFSSICHSIEFLDCNETLDDMPMLKPPADSWFILKEPMMAGDADAPPFLDLKTRTVETTSGWIFKEKKTFTEVWKVHERIPQMFVELSPSLMGPGALRELLNVNFDLGQALTMSSPKRYVWDRDPVGAMGGNFWNMIPNPWNKDKHDEKVRLATVRGLMFRFMPEDGSTWEFDNPPTSWENRASRPKPEPQQPRFPRCDTMTWAALAIIESGYRQIMSKTWRQQGQFLPRRLRNICVTFPSGWTLDEITAYRERWDKAINTFTHCHLKPGDPRPELVMELDEAVASQLPIIYSEIARLDRRADRWIEVVGRGKENEAVVRVLSLDIGGGTTDISILAYQNRLPHVTLSSTLLFKDSSTVAGDRLMKVIIENVLLPTIAAKLPDDMRQPFASIFSRTLRTIAERNRWTRYVRVVFIPIVRHWLTNLCEGTENYPPLSEILPPKELEFVDALNAEIQAVLGTEAALLPTTEPIPPLPSIQAIAVCIRETFGDLFQSMAAYVDAFDCDWAIVTGKPSELPEIRRLLLETLPLSPSRVVSAKNYPAGSWFPLDPNGIINDAKLVTVVGGSLYQAMKNNLVTGWHIERHVAKEMYTRNRWGVMPEGPDPRFQTVYLETDQDQASIDIMIDTQIGRKMSHSNSRPDPVYVFRWKNRTRRENATMKATLKRVPPLDPLQGERLELVEAKGKLRDGSAVTVQDVELILCTLPRGEDYWLDSGRFEVRWPQEEGAF